MPYALICNDPITLHESVRGGEIGKVYLIVNGVQVPAVFPYCSSGFQQVEHVPPFDTSQLEPSTLTALFGAGFLLYLTPWAAAWGLKQLVKAIK